MAKNTVTYYIIGGGVAGLFCAKIIKQKVKNAKVVLCEAKSYLGGRSYSYYDEGFKCNLDNGTHVIIGANKELKKFVSDNEWESDIRFWDVSTNEICSGYTKNISHLFKSACNTMYENIAPVIKKKILGLTFPWTRNKTKIYFSKQNLSQKIINNLASYPDEILYASKLNKIECQFGCPAQLILSNRQIELAPDDKVILALDNVAYAKLMGEPTLPCNSIINIFYHTSEPIYLPNGARVLGVLNGLSDWVFVNDNMLGVTISAANKQETSLPELARMVWQELDLLRGVNSAFVPPFRAFKHKYATIMQDEYTNSLRPDSALSGLPNVYVAGDWTMKNYPCCLETAYLSALRAVKATLK